MPFHEQGSLHSLIDFNQPLTIGLAWNPQVNPAIATVAGSRMPVLMCPSDAGNPMFTDTFGFAWAGGNYLVNGGSGAQLNYCSSSNDGLFWRGSTIKIRDITDGTSNTAFMAETLFGNRQAATTTLVNAQRQMKRVSLGSPCGPMAEVLETTASTNFTGNRAGIWISSTGFHTLIQGYYPPNSKSPDFGNHGEVVSGPRSLHIGGAQISLCDGSVRFISENVNLAIFRNVFARNDGQVLGEF